MTTFDPRRALTQAFAPIPGGWFTMGTLLGHEDERPPHLVFVDRFELGVCPVTRAEYECFVDATKNELPREWSHPLFAHADLPVVGVSWIDAVAYCAWRSAQDGRPVRLPTERCAFIVVSARQPCGAKRHNTRSAITSPNVVESSRRRFCGAAP